MIDQWLAVEGQIFAAVLFGVVTLVAAVEGIIPRRVLHAPRGRRWAGNILIYLIDVLIVRAVFPILVVGMGVLAAERGWGLLNLVSIPTGVSAIVAIVVIDLSRYLQHYLLHRSWLWRLHIVHHTDQDYDFSTGLRFHPLESVLTIGYDVAVILLLGPPLIAVLAYETIKLAWATVAHANIRIPLTLDRHLRKVVVTPDLHRIHHSATVGETNSNFGAISPVWDKLFGTYLDQPALGHDDMIIGLPEYQDHEHLKLGHMLLQPFRRQQ